MKRTIQTYLWVLAAVCAVALPSARAQETPPVDPQQLARDSLELLQQTTSNTLLATWSQVQQIIGGLQVWTADALDDVNSLANQAGVALDTFVPSVQGCIRDTDGTPLVGATVLGLTLFGPSIPDAGLQIAGTTAGQAAPATFGAIGGGPIPVNPAWLSETQNANWGPGCYWMPAMPSATALLASAIVAGFGSPIDIQFLRVIPLIPGYAVEPGAKEVFISGGNYLVRDITSPFAQGTLSDSGSAN